jgi:hypothetical protein
MWCPRPCPRCSVSCRPLNDEGRGTSDGQTDSTRFLKVPGWIT